MTRRRVRFYFAYNSPYAFLANTRIVRELAPFDVELEYKPVYAPRTGLGTDHNSPRIRYLYEDVARFADAYGIALRPGPFADSRRACLGFFWARAQGGIPAYHDAVFRARWLEGRNIAADSTLAAAAEAAGLSATALLVALDDPQWAKALEQSNAEAEADGVFGFPFFVLGDKHFWGNDRLEWLVRELQKR